MFENIVITKYQGSHTCDICKAFEAKTTPATFLVNATRRDLKIHTHLCGVHIQKWQVKDAAPTNS